MAKTDADEPNTPEEVYKRIIDQLVERSASVDARLVREGRLRGGRVGSEEDLFIQSLTAEQREVLAKMLDSERRGGIGAALADLTWWIHCRDVALTWRGESMPIELSHMGMHGDFVGRLNDWQWPGEDESAN